MLVLRVLPAGNRAAEVGGGGAAGAALTSLPRAVSGVRFPDRKGLTRPSQAPALVSVEDASH